MGAACKSMWGIEEAVRGREGVEKEKEKEDGHVVFERSW